jgi:hypothetical protein
MDQRPFAKGGFPLKLTTAVRLIGSLLYLQLLYAISHLAKPFWNYGREFPPFNKTIDQTETSISNAILGIAPLTAYSSATATERQWRLASGSSLLNYTKPTLVVPTCTETTAIASSLPQMAHRCPDSSTGEGIQNENEDPTLPIAERPRTSSSIYDTMQKIKSSTRGSISTIASSAKAIFHQTGTSQPLSPVLRNLDGSASNDRFNEEFHPAPAKPVSISQRLAKSLPFPAPVSRFPTARLADHFSDTGPSSGFKGKGEMPEAVVFGAAVDPSVDSETVQMDRSRKYHSIESYPGKFPVSDALDYSSLASAFAVRGRGTTSVRPFSDY